MSEWGAVIATKAWKDLISTSFLPHSKEEVDARRMLEL